MVWRVYGVAGGFTRFRGIYHRTARSSTSMAIPKRLQLQLEHIRDLIKEQNRMLITQIEPTSSERNDVLSLLDSIRDTVSTSPKPVVTEISNTYNSILSELSELGYNIGPYELVIQEEEAPPQRRKSIKHVHFEHDEDPLKTDEDNRLIRDNSLGSSNGRNVSNISNDFYTPYTDTPPSEPQSELSSTQLYQQNNYLYDDQDRRLEEISGNVNRQRLLGEGITSELDVHNDLLDDLESQTERSQSRLDGLTRGVHNFNRRSRECGVCSIIIALVLILFILLLI